MGIKVLKNETGATVTIRPGMIIMTTESSLPTGWVDCDGSNSTPNLQDHYIKNTTVDLEAGSNTHSHSQSHSHTFGAHTHPYTTATNANGGLSGYGPDVGGYKWTQNHDKGSGTTDITGSGTS